MTENKDEARRLAELIAPLRVEPGRQVRLQRDFDPRYKDDFLSRDDAEGVLRAGVELLSDYQARLAAQDAWGLLVVLQAIDAGGKDSTIRHVMSGVNPQGVRVSSFKIPSNEELDHDYLWRYAARLPSRGEIGIFNRSHYEEVLVVRVHPELLAAQRLPPEAKGPDIWKRRFREINDWERYLVDNGIHIVKLFLNVSREEQRQRFLERVERRDKNWKFSPADVKERAFWDDYQHAFSEMLSHTSTEWAPWHVIPADRKWFAHVAAAAAIVSALVEIDPRYPELDEEKLRELERAKAELDAEAPGADRHGR